MIVSLRRTAIEPVARSAGAQEESMPALASLEELREVDGKVKEFRDTFPEAYRLVAQILKKYRKVGYKNIIKLLLEESTPEKLKGEAG